MRKRLRALVKLVPHLKRGVVYTDFEDELGDLSLPEIRSLPPGPNRTRFAAKVRTYVRSHAGDMLVRKVRSNQQLTTADLDELAERFVDAGFGTMEDVEQATRQYEGFGLFMRAMTGLDYKAAAAALSGVRPRPTSTPQQDAYLELLIEVTAKNGVATVDDLYKSPFTNRARGPEDLFTDADIDAILEALQDIQAKAQPPTGS